jgi:guanylate cyclase soluble subunit alpha
MGSMDVICDLVFFISDVTQDSLKRRMDKLKNSIEEASHAVDEERGKNVNLLQLIFPPDIARKLWLGK